MLLTDYWDRIWSGLGPQQRDQVASAARELARTSPDQPVNPALHAFLDAVSSGLPEGDPIRFVAPTTQSSSSGGSAEAAAAVEPEPEPEFFPDPEARKALNSMLSARLAAIVRWQVRSRLLAEPSFTAAEVQARGVDPDSNEVIRLPGDDNGENVEPRFPAFQFDPDGSIRATVAQVNVLLGASTDPWGAADWWLGRNARLGAVPAESLGSDDAELLEAAATLATRERW